MTSQYTIISHMYLEMHKRPIGPGFEKPGFFGQSPARVLTLTGPGRVSVKNVSPFRSSKRPAVGFFSDLKRAEPDRAFFGIKSNRDFMLYKNVLYVIMADMC